jgi:hypothetical protein
MYSKFVIEYTHTFKNGDKNEKNIIGGGGCYWHGSNLRFGE